MGSAPKGDYYPGASTSSGLVIEARFTREQNGQAYWLTRQHADGDLLADMLGLDRSDARSWARTVLDEW